MIESYNKLYLPNVAENVGTMFEYAVARGIDPEHYWNLFIFSDVAKQIEKGNPVYLAGRSAIEMLSEFIKNVEENVIVNKQRAFFNRTQYFWVGWALAQYQWSKGISFSKIAMKMSIKRVLELYSTLHEADITKFYETADEYVNKPIDKTNLKLIRSASKLSQSKLSKLSGVDIRSIQMYEQQHNDINKAQVETVMKLARVLGCNIEDLINI